MGSFGNNNNARSSDTTERFSAGDKVGRYRLIALLASGGMGHVWAARPDGGGFTRTVALKLVRAEMSRDENYSRMFIDEATVASAIRHPNVCETFELGRHGDTLFMAMEWVAGDSLAGLLRQEDALVPLEPPIAVRIVADACAGLHAAHESVGHDGTLLGVVHRDISPPNILVSSQGQAKVSDFGIAKARYQLHERTRTGEIKGKFAYIPPEQLAGDEVDRRADVYAMGCVLYVATTGRRPFGNGAQALSKILRNQYEAPRRLIADYPEELQAIIVKALSGKPQDRYQTAEEMQVALEEWLITEGRVVTVSDVAKCVQSRLSKQMRERNAALVSQSRILPDQLLQHGIVQDTDTDAETPTAGSVVVTVRPGQWRNSPRASNPDDHTLDGVQVAAMKEPAHSAHSAPPSSGVPSSGSELTPIASLLSDPTQLVVVQVHDLDSPSKAPASVRKPGLSRGLGLLLLLAAVVFLMVVLARR